MILGMDKFVRAHLELPYGLAKVAFWILSKKLSFTFSGMPGPKIPWKYGPYQTHNLGVFIPPVGDMQVGITQFSMGPTFLVGLITDKNQIRNPDQFMQILHNNFNSFIYPKGTAMKKMKNQTELD